MKKLSAIMAVLILTIGAGIFLHKIQEYYSPDLSLIRNDSVLEVHTNTSNGVSSQCQLVILIHDVSPVYLKDLKEITEIISEYGMENSTYLFVIPNHADNHPIEDYPDFVKFLKESRANGYHIELHGYTHEYREFDCDAETARKKLELGLESLKALNFSPSYFIPPNYAISEDALKVVLSHNLSVITKDSLYTPQGRPHKIMNREYTWYLSDSSIALKLALEKAKHDYKKCRGTFYLSIHPKAVNHGVGLKFLREFLQFVQRE
ncbi:DUF2334 domain-containing protein [Thermococcus stetteri]|uniref:DUF2334 domain-containing protein n=1 Tax=Thermococcus stetteri TaxID=49900 RepID=UPI001AE6CFAC|nr:DUF2334 domain-containing protein [Thermococcus stetteri]MBP1912012.1 putative deacetylase [Thermococcus stetteri]